MIPLDQTADTFPVGMAGTPFEDVYRALRIMAATVWSVDPLAYRAGMSWGWYALHDPAALVGFRDVVTAALISEIAPMVKDTQTDAELVEYLRQWRSYTPTFPKLQAIYALFGVVVDVQPISDPEGQALLPVDDTRLAFYIFVLSMDWSRPMLLGEIAETARRASPLGARPFVVYYVEGFVSVPVAIAPTDGFLWVDVRESAVPVAPPGPTLPTVTALPAIGQDMASIASQRNTYALKTWDAGGWYGTYISVDAAKVYAIYEYADGNGGYKSPVGIFETTSVGGSLGAKNISSSSQNFRSMKSYSCSDSTATVVTVYNSSNVAYNAFKFTTNNTDYYYVLDGTQTDWTDDLASIGYHLPVQYIEVILYLSRTLNTVTFSANDYWASLAETTVSVNALNDFGVPLRTYDNKKFISSAALSGFSFEPIALYDNNDNNVQADMSNFYCAAGPNNPSSDYGNNINIYSVNPYQTAVKTWKCRITKL